ncbi:MAG: adenylate/guanylate cyclase domain-containing protein [Bacteroidota bacterium]
MRKFGHEIVDDGKPFTLLEHVRFHLALGVVAGLIFGSLEYVIEQKIFRRVSFGKLILIGSVTYFISVLLLIIFGMHIFTRIMQVDMSREIYHRFMFSQEMWLLVFYCFLVGFFIDFIREIDKKFGPGNLIKMLKGEFYDPKEDQRIFMFLDLKSSTTIAEKLGHRKYSRLIQSCFQDLSDIVIQHKANIYQYVGDEVVLSWPVEKGLENLNCINFYFAYRDHLRSRKSYYMGKFGLVPEFKAGLEMGKVTVAEVGEIKREIAYHGDVLNTASRIQGCCNDFKKHILISENLEKAIEVVPKPNVELVGDIKLKGKSQNLKIYSVEEGLVLN